MIKFNSFYLSHIFVSVELGVFKERINMIRIGINGYGNLGRGVEKAIAKNPDMELVSILKTWRWY